MQIAGLYPGSISPTCFTFGQLIGRTPIFYLQKLKQVSSYYRSGVMKHNVKGTFCLHQGELNAAANRQVQLTCKESSNIHGKKKKVESQFSAGNRSCILGFLKNVLIFLPWRKVKVRAAQRKQ